MVLADTFIVMLPEREHAGFLKVADLGVGDRHRAGCRHAVGSNGVTHSAGWGTRRGVRLEDVQDFDVVHRAARVVEEDPEQPRTRNALQLGAGRGKGNPVAGPVMVRFSMFIVVAPAALVTTAPV